MEHWLRNRQRCFESRLFRSGMRSRLGTDYLRIGGMNLASNRCFFSALSFLVASHIGGPFDRRVLCRNGTLREEKYKKHAPVLETICAKYKGWRIHRTTEDGMATRVTKWLPTWIDRCVVQPLATHAPIAPRPNIARLLPESRLHAQSPNIECYRC